MWFGTELTFLTNLSRVPEQTGQISGSSAPNILPSRVQIPDTSSTLLSFIVKFVLFLSREKNENKQKEARFGLFPKNKTCRMFPVQ